jgi:flagellar biosynthesis GTPase FlhF
MINLDLNSSISSLRELLKDEISDKAKFLFDGIGVPIKDEKSILLSLITKEEKIYIEDNDKNDFDNQSNSGSSKKGQEKIQIQNKITITLRYDNDENTLTKASLSDKLDKIRDDNQIPETYIFTFNGTEIRKKQENEFSIEDVLDSDSKSVLLKNLRPKKKIKIFDEDNKSIKCEKQYEISEKLSKLRKDLNLNDNKIFTRNSHEINIDDEDNFTIEDVEIDGVINIINKNSKFSIFVNNNLVKSESFSPSITIRTLRTYLTKDIPKECNFLHATKQTPIPIEMEDNIIISKICNENNYIFIESEQKKLVNKPLDKAEKLRKEGNVDIYLFPSRKFIIGLEKNSENEKKECLNISKEIDRKIIMVIGQTGSGKTTLLNSLINALCGIQLKDDFRYIIIDELASDSGVEDPNNQSKSRTSYVTVYNIDSIMIIHQSQL